MTSEHPQTTYTYCHICEQLCGIEVKSDGYKISSIRPDQRNPYSWRDFCIKAARSGDVVSHPHRVTAPLKREGSTFVVSTYEEAVADIAIRMKGIVEAYGPQAVGYYNGNPSGFSFGNAPFLTALMKAIGTRNYFSVGSVDQNAFHVVGQGMFGNPWVALLPDVANCDCFLFVGANPAISMMNWVGKVPNGWRQVVDRVQAGADLIVVDPRRTETAQKATLHIAPLPEQDWALLLGMIQVILSDGLERPTYPELLKNLDLLRHAAFLEPVEQLAKRCDVDAQQIADAARIFARAPTAVAIARTGSAQGRNGVLAEWLTQVLNVITGRMDVVGGRFMPSWPLNLAEAAATMFPPHSIPSRVRGLAPVAGAYSLAELPDEIMTPGPGKIRAFVINGGNPVSSGPAGKELDGALSELELLVSVDLLVRESHRHSHWIIPGVHFLEKTEVNVLTAASADIPFIQSSRKAVAAPPGVIPEWQFFKALAEEMDLTLFDGGIDVHPDALADALLGLGEMTTVAKIREAPHGLIYGERSIGHFWKLIKSSTGHVDVCPEQFCAQLERELETCVGRLDTAQYPLQMISRRRKNTMNSWLSDTTGLMANDVRSNVVELNLDDAAELGVTLGDTVTVASSIDSLTARVVVSDAPRRGVAVIEHGWGSRLFDPTTGSVCWDVGVARNTLVGNTDLDPLSGVPRLNGMPVKVIRSE